MKVHIIGGGPAGLYFAILMKKLNPSHDVVVLDRGKPWTESGRLGTLFSDRSFSYLADSDQETHDAVSRQAQVAEQVRATYGGQELAVRVGPMAALSRKALLDVLRERARGLRVDMRFDTAVRDVRSFRDSDLLVGADGEDSPVRDAFQGHFLPTVELRRTRFWRLGTPQTFTEPRWILAERDGLRLLAHVWQFAPDRSSFVVECREDRWRDSDFALLSDSEAAERLAEMFRTDLRGRSLSLEPGETWRRNRVIRNEHWVHENVVLLGSAASRAHFAFGHGFRRALEDAAALASALRIEEGVVQALDLYEFERQAIVERDQRAAEASVRWVEELLGAGEVDPVTLAYELATRTQNLTHGELQRLDPPFVAEYERVREASART